MVKEKVRRFAVSISPRLFEKFSSVMVDKGYTNRSEAIRDLIRDSVVEREWEDSKGEVVGCVVLVYEHDIRGVAEKLTHIQHDHQNIVSSMHVHLDEHTCMEALVVKGTGAEVKKMSDLLIGARGVKHGKLVMTTVGRDLG